MLFSPQQQPKISLSLHLLRHKHKSLESDMTIYRRPSKDEEHRSLLHIVTKNPTINVSFSTLAILIGCGFLIGALYAPLSGSSSNKSDNIRAIFNNIRGDGTYLDPKTATFKEGFLNKNPFSPKGGTMEVRDVHVTSMCRCPSDLVPFPIMHQEQNLFETRIIQPPSKATGSYHKRFIHHPIGECQCRRGLGPERLEPTRTTDHFMSKLSRSFFVESCSREFPETESQTSWDQMPDFGVQQDRPIFVGVLSYESPLSLNNSLHNWLENDVFHRIAAQDVFVQLNHRSSHDDAILYEFQQSKLNDRHTITITGAPEENLNPGLAISKFCRMAEQHPSSHPNGENLLLWLEKDWVIIDNAKKLRLEKIFQSAVSLSQRGVPYIGLRADLGEAEESRMWNCPAEGVPWRCTTAHQHRWLNLPSLIDCKWFLRYLEPFALMTMTDPIMWCGRKDGYCDWEKAGQDGRIAWTNSQWVMAFITRGDGGQLFQHQEIDK